MKIIEIDVNLKYVTQKHILHGVNCQGVAGAGVALLLRQMHPKMFIEYTAHCALFKDKKEELLGTIQVVDCDKKVIINGFTQLNYGASRQQVDYDALRKVFKAVNKYAKENSITEIVMPKIGSGLGGGDWNEIVKIIEEESIDFQPVVSIKSK